MADSSIPTPLFHHIDGPYLKCEFLHPGRSHKARVAGALIDDVEERGLIKPGSDRVLLERTGGNLGIALAIEARARGYALTLVTDPHYAASKRILAAKLGANVVDRTLAYPDATSNGQVIDLLLLHDPARYVYLNQFGNPANPRAHRDNTGAEICLQLRQRGLGDGVILVGGLGTGASMRGITDALRPHFTVRTVAVEPANCDLMSAVFRDHALQGIAVGEPAPFYPVTDLDDVVRVADAEAFDACNDLWSRNRLLVGPSSGANFAAARRLSQDSSHPRRPAVLTLLYDRGEDYL